MSYGPFSVFPVTMTSGATLTPQVALARAWEMIYLEVPTMVSNTQIFIQAADTTSGTFRRVYFPPLNSSTVGTNPFAIVSGATNCFVPIPNGHRFIKVETSATVDGGCTFNIICASP